MTLDAEAPLSQPHLEIFTHPPSYYCRIPTAPKKHSAGWFDELLQQLCTGFVEMEMHAWALNVEIEMNPGWLGATWQCCGNESGPALKVCCQLLVYYNSTSRCSFLLPFGHGEGWRNKRWMGELLVVCVMSSLARERSCGAHNSSNLSLALSGDELMIGAISRSFPLFFRWMRS